MDTFISKSSEDTQALGEQWGRTAQRGWVIGLTGDLGAGKTQLVKGLARGLGVTDAVRSPTFALVNEYAGGRLPLAHLDFYRLDTPQEIFKAGLEEYLLKPGGVTVVEWIERWLLDVSSFKFQVSGSVRRYRHVRIEVVSETQRRITYEDFGD